MMFSPRSAVTTSTPIASSRQERIEPLGVRALVGLIAVLVVTTASYLVNLSASGFGNSFYAAASQAGSENWTAFFFGSSDGANSVTVDKTPLSLWPSGLAVRLFGLSSWSILTPYVIVGVAAVAMLWFTVRRYAGTSAAFISAVVLATTPVAALMFRYNNPDALLVLLMICSVWAVLRACEDGRWRWAVWAGVFIGLGFLAKQLQVVLILPALVLAFLVASPRSWRIRAGQLLAALVAMIFSAGWYLLLVELWPKDSRPYIGGSQDNSIVELTLGYNGLGRINGDETGAVTGGGLARGEGGASTAMGEMMGGGGTAGAAPGGGTGGGMWGSTGILRMFEPAQGGQIAWLIPAALVLFVVLLVMTRRRPRTDLLRASVLVWGVWLVVTALVFSFMKGIFHQYYTVALAPAVAALVGIGISVLWSRRSNLRWCLWVLAVVAAITASWSVVLLGRSSDFVPWLRAVVVVAGVVAVIGLVVMAFGMVQRIIVWVVLISGSVAALAGPVAYSVQTIAMSHNGAIVTAGPEVDSGGFAGGRGGPGSMGRAGGFPGINRESASPMAQGDGGGSAIGAPGMAPGAMGESAGPTGMPGPAAGMHGGGLNGGTADEEVSSLLRDNADNYTWVAAAVGSQTAATYQLAVEHPVMSIGGYNGSDPTPTLEEFVSDVEEGRIHFFLASGEGGRGQQMGGSSVSSEISAWVSENYVGRTVGSVTVYDLTSSAAGAKAENG